MLYVGYGAIHRHKIRARQSLCEIHRALYYLQVLLAMCADVSRPIANAHLIDWCHQCPQSYDFRHTYQAHCFGILASDQGLHFRRLKS